MKAIFVDGPSLFHIGRRLGIRAFHFEKLRIFLENIGESGTLAFKPIVVLRPDLWGNSVGKSYRTAGFGTIEARTVNSEDDRAIIDRIESLGEEVREIIILTTDQDYAPALRQKAAAGVKVYWVGAEVVQPDGLYIMGAELMALIAQEFSFIDLALYKDELAMPPRSEIAPQSALVPARAPMKITVIGEAEDHAAVLEAFSKLLSMRPRMQYRIES